MALLITLSIATVAGYLKMTVNEEIEAVSAGLVTCLCLFLSLFFAPLVLKLALLAVLLAFRKIELKDCL